MKKHKKNLKEHEDLKEWEEYLKEREEDLKECIRRRTLPFLSPFSRSKR